MVLAERAASQSWLAGSDWACRLRADSNEQQRLELGGERAPRRHVESPVTGQGRARTRRSRPRLCLSSRHVSIMLGRSERHWKRQVHELHDGWMGRASDRLPAADGVGRLRRWVEHRRPGRGAGQGGVEAGTGRVQQIAYVPPAPMRRCRPVSTRRRPPGTSSSRSPPMSAPSPTPRSARAGRARS